jgi:hypothetical protein
MLLFTLPFLLRSGWPWEIQSEAGDPTVTPIPAPVGTTLRNISNGKLYQKVGPANTDWKLLAFADAASPPGFYGFAQLGDVTLNSGGTVLTTSLTPPLVQFTLFFKNLTITNNTKLKVDPSIGTSSLIFVDGTLTIDAGSSIDASGADGSGGGNGGTGGANSFSAGSGTADGGSGGPNTVGGTAFTGDLYWVVAPKTAGSGGAGGVNAGGNPQFTPAANPFNANHFNVNPFSSILLGARAQGGDVGNTCGGGGGGADTGTVRGGGGGGGGGILVIYARHVALADGTLVANGGNGESGSGPGPGNAGGGGGGLGGVVVLITQDQGVPPSVASVVGGNGSSGFGAGGFGRPGSGGEIIVVDPTGTSWVHA